MKPAQKFTTFDELKSCEGEIAKYGSSLKKHKDFAKVIMDIRSKRIHQAANQTK